MTDNWSMLEKFVEMVKYAQEDIFLSEPKAKRADALEVEKKVRELGLHLQHLFEADMEAIEFLIDRNYKRIGRFMAALDNYDEELFDKKYLAERAEFLKEESAKKKFKEARQQAIISMGLRVDDDAEREYYAAMAHEPAEELPL